MIDSREAAEYQVDDPLTVDGNAVAGLLHEIFGVEMTLTAARCAHCGNRGPLGGLRVYDLRGPGVVLRCSVCSEIVMRFMTRPDGSHLVDIRGATYIRI
jgi:hypothetical protein